MDCFTPSTVPTQCVAVFSLQFVGRKEGGLEGEGGRMREGGREGGRVGTVYCSSL